MKQEPITILLADSHSASRDILRLRLEDVGYRVRTAGRGGEVVLQCRIEAPDVVILDMNLPDMDGFEVCERIRHVASAAEPAIIVLTEAQDDMSKTYLAQMVDFAGGDFFLSKPYDRNLLLQLVDDVAKQARQNRKRRHASFPTRVVWPTKHHRALASAVG